MKSREEYLMEALDTTGWEEIQKTLSQTRKLKVELP